MEDYKKWRSVVAEHTKWERSCECQSCLSKDMESPERPGVQSRGRKASATDKIVPCSTIVHGGDRCVHPPGPIQVVCPVDGFTYEAALCLVFNVTPQRDISVI